VSKPNDYSKSDRERIMRAFLKAFAKSGNFTHSCRVADIPNGTMRAWLEKSELLARKFEEMEEKFVDSLEMEAIQRARDGSDSLLALLLRANRPKKFRESVKVEGGLDVRPSVNLVFSPNEWGNMPNYALGGEPDGGGSTEKEKD
jgi:hypothetical protein